MNLFSLGCWYLFADEIIISCSNTSKSHLTLFSKGIGALNERFFSQTASSLSGRCSEERIFLTSNLMWHKPRDLLKKNC